MYSHDCPCISEVTLWPIEAEWRIYASVKHTNIASDNDLSPIRRQAIIWNNAIILLIRPQGTYFSEILFETRKFSFKKMHLKMLSVGASFTYWLYRKISNIIPTKSQNLTDYRLDVQLLLPSPLQSGVKSIMKM